MDWNLIWLMIGVMVCWGGYPVLEKMAVGVHPAWIAALLVAGSIPTGSLGLVFEKTEAPTGKAASIILLCGAILGLGMFFFGKILALPKLDIGKIFAIEIAATCVFTTVLCAVFLGESFPPMKIGAIAGIVVCVYVLNL
ncbi:MAG: hypothetical protein UW30_C0002G0024 [Candidatus Giovannonibacteria bacterium GW2011_GWA2_44_13b]|uniref:EamA domain-containing protein n=2 Tax=Candidatus Giovannoniibacteriota TaxID=1752738 RepID=A0A0G1H6L2_9BACT|nr:MAG: hypothetical protein UW30_C0002G0024 [Candidatus Giovannonibacteria bacterium GW2011_GWA2_44_13b]OGF81584.1 MAG: hypothetical protein A2924_02450 [Candidatus Giovannonibacteria bacterium RIFCSPLOWO2_01_FULL_44_16]